MGHKGAQVTIFFLDVATLSPTVANVQDDQRINSRIDPELSKQLRKIEDATKLSRSDIVRSALRFGLPMLQRDSALYDRPLLVAAPKRRKAR